MEALLQRENFNTYMRLCRFQELDKLPFYDFLIKSKEIECILSMINNINSGLDNSYLNDLPGYVIKHSKVSLLEMSRAENYEQLLKILRNTPYYKILVKNTAFGGRLSGLYRVRAKAENSLLYRAFEYRKA